MPSELKQFRIPMTDDQHTAVENATTKHGYKSAAAYIRAVLAGEAPLPDDFKNEVQARGKYPRTTQS